MSLYKLIIGEMLGMVYSVSKLSSVCVPMKLKTKLSASKIQWWDRHRIIVRDVFPELEENSQVKYWNRAHHLFMQ